MNEVRVVDKLQCDHTAMLLSHKSHHLNKLRSPKIWGSSDKVNNAGLEIPQLFHDLVYQV